MNARWRRRSGAPAQRNPPYFFASRCFACSAAGLLGYFETRVRSVLRDALRSPVSAWLEAMLSIASGAFWLSGQVAISFCCAAIAFL
jgi:hypothetical protein